MESKKNKVLTVGEPMIVFSSRDLDQSLIDSEHFTTFPSGAELNVAVGLEKLGIKTTYLSNVGKDLLGKKIVKFMRKQEIDIRYLRQDDEWPTGFYFKELVSKGDPQVSYCRKNSAASHLCCADLAKINISDFQAVHVTGILAALSTSTLHLTKKILTEAEKQEVISFFDPNIRMSLWHDKEKMIRVLNDLSFQSKVVLPGSNEGKILTGTSDPKEIASFYLSKSDITKLVVVKLGAKGAYYQTSSGSSGYVKGYHTDKIVDTVGAGDGFAVGLISGLISGLEIKRSVKRACAIGSLAIQSHGDNDGYPNVSQLEQFMRKNNKCE